MAYDSSSIYDQTSTYDQVALPTTAGWYVLDPNGTLAPCNLFEELKSDGTLAVLRLPNPGEGVQSANSPDAPTNLALVGTPASTSASFSWTAPTTGGVLDGYRIYIGTTKNGSDISSSLTTGSATGLSANTTYLATVVAFNSTGESRPSNQVSFTTDAAVAGVPTAPATLTDSSVANTSLTLSWTEDADSTVTRHTLYKGGVAQTTSIGATTTTLSVTGLTAGTSYDFAITRSNANGESDPSPTDTVTTTGGSAAASMWMGCSDSAADHGGTNVWDGWRSYTKSSRNTLANRTGTQRPKFIAYSEQGTPFDPSIISDIQTHVADDLETFYYTSTGAHSTRWGIKLYWSNGNENSDKGILSTPHTQSGIDAFVASQKALYLACHTLNSDGTRRYPDAYAGSDPTHDHERQGIVQDWLHPSAQYHDFVMWSMYPPGRQNTPDDPTFTKPSISESDLSTGNGFLIRCFYRTSEARRRARTDTGNSNFDIAIGTGEVGIGDDPNDSSHRPYYACHSLAGVMQTLRAQYSLTMPFTCWWDWQSNTTSPQNKLSDEPTSTSPSTREAWQNWLQYNHNYGGTHPSSWPNPGPRSTWPTGA